jgi:hypothetical protein
VFLLTVCEMGFDRSNLKMEDKNELIWLDETEKNA